MSSSLLVQDPNRSWANAMECQQIGLIGSEQFLECREAGGVEGSSGGSADSMRDFGHALNLGRWDDIPR